MFTQNAQALLLEYKPILRAPLVEPIEYNVTREVPDTLIVDSAGTSYYSYEQYELNQEALDIENTVFEGLEEGYGAYWRDYRYMRLERGGDIERVYYYKTDDECPGYGEQILEKLEYNMEYTVLGSGHFSTVVVCPWDDTKVIKIGYGPGGDRDYRSDGWLAWAAFCMYMHTQGDYPFLPKIHDIILREDFFVALIDRYDCTANELDYAEYTSLGALQAVKESYWSMRAALDHYIVSHEPSVVKNLEAQMREVFEHPLCPLLNDVHSGNIMIDTGNLTAVLTDPSSRDYCVGSARGEILRKLGIMI